MLMALLSMSHPPREQEAAGSSVKLMVVKCDAPHPGHGIVRRSSSSWSPGWYGIAGMKTGPKRIRTSRFGGSNDPRFLSPSLVSTMPHYVATRGARARIFGISCKSFIILNICSVIHAESGQIPTARVILTFHAAPVEPKLSAYVERKKADASQLLSSREYCSFSNRDEGRRIAIISQRIRDSRCSSI